MTNNVTIGEKLEVCFVLPIGCLYVCLCVLTHMCVCMCVCSFVHLFLFLSTFRVMLLSFWLIFGFVGLLFVLIFSFLLLLRIEPGTGSALQTLITMVHATLVLISFYKQFSDS